MTAHAAGRVFGYAVAWLGFVAAFIVPWLLGLREVVEWLLR